MAIYKFTLTSYFLIKKKSNDKKKKIIPVNKTKIKRQNHFLTLFFIN